MARISIRYSVTSPGTTGCAASRVSRWNGFHSVLRSGSSARLEAFSQPRVSSRSGRFAGTSHSPSRAVCTDGSGPTSLRITIQFVSSWSIDAQRFSTDGPATRTSCGSGSLRNRRPATSRVCVSGIWTNESGGTRSSADSGVKGSVRRRSQLDR